MIGAPPRTEDKSAEHQVSPARAGHLILVGLPGSGKSTVGRIVAERLRRSFFDFDVEIERRQHKSVAQLFFEQGEPAFRGMEVILTAELATMPPAVLAPGGGWLTNPGVLALVRPPGRIIHLKVSPEGALQRLGSASASRPLLMESDPRQVLETLWKRRAPLYALADAEVDTEALEFQRVADQVVLLLRELDTAQG